MVRSESRDTGRGRQQVPVAGGRDMGNWVDDLVGELPISHDIWERASQHWFHGRDLHQWRLDFGLRYRNDERPLESREHQFNGTVPGKHVLRATPEQHRSPHCRQRDHGAVPHRELGFDRGECNMGRHYRWWRVTFINSSVRRNLQFVGGSVVDQGADISVEGLAPISGGRDVYLQVQKYLMPETAGPGDTLRDTTQLFNPRMGLAAVRMPPQPTIRQITAWIPSYRVHVYHSTGANIWIDGVKYPLLEQQSSFGFFVIHRGPLEGWGSILEGAQPMGPNWFRIRNVVGVAKIRTRIQARAPGEPPIKPEGGGGGIKCPGSKLLGGIVLSLGMLAMAWVSYRKPKRRN